MSDIDVDKYVKENSCNFGLLAIPENCHGMRFKYLSIKTLPIILYIHNDDPICGFDVYCHLTHLMHLCIRFLFVRLRFRYPFFSPVPHDTNLGVAFEFVGNYASVDFHHRALICPSYNKKAPKENLSALPSIC